MNPEVVRNFAVLQTIEGDALTRLAASLEEREFADGQAIFKEGDHGDAIYFIHKGTIRIEKRARAAGGVTKTLSVLEAGDYFGEMSLFEQKPRSASALATGPTTVLRLSKTAFEELCSANSAVGRNVVSAMIRTSSERIRRLSRDVVVYDEIGKAIAESEDLETLSNLILQQLSMATAADWGLLLTCSPFSKRFEVQAQLHVLLTPSQREAISHAKGFLQTARQNPSDLLVDNVDAEEPFKSCARLGFETPSLLLTPIKVDDQFLGLIVLGGKKRQQFSVNHQNLARGVATQVGEAFLNTREDLSTAENGRFEVSCPYCKKMIKKTLAWFDKISVSCPYCGGIIDTKPFQFELSKARKAHAAKDV